MRLSSWYRPSGNARAILSANSQASQDRTRPESDACPVELPHTRKRLRRVRLFGFSPITHLLLVLLGSFLLVYLFRGPLDRLLPGLKDAIEGTMARSSKGIARATQGLSTTVEGFYSIGARTVAPYTGKAPSATAAGTGAVRAVSLPYYAAVPARPRLAVPNLRVTKGVRSGECGQGCSVLRMPDKSLEPAIKKGQLLLVDSYRVPAPGDVVWVAYRGRPYLRRFFPNGDRVRLVPGNPSFHEISAARNEVHINGVLVRLVDPG